MSKSRQLFTDYPIAIVVLVTVVLLTEILFKLLQCPNFINPDCAFQLVTAKQILDGGQPFTDFVVTSQPIWFYLNNVVWCLSSISNVSIQTTWIFLNWLTICVAAAMTGVVVKQARTDRENDWMALGCMLTSFLLLHLSMTYHIGQRELLFTSAYFPLFLVRWQRWQGYSPSRIPAIGSALLLMIIVFVEPILLAIPISVEVGFFLAWFLKLSDEEALKNRALKQLVKTPEVLTIATTAAVLLFSSCLVPNQEEYYSRWVPLLIEGHQVYSQSWNRLLWLASSDGELVGSRFLIGLICLTAFVFRRQCSFFIPLLLWTASAWLIYIVDGTCEAHRTIPFVFGFFLIAGIECMLISSWLLAKIVANHWISTLSKSSCSFLNNHHSRSMFIVMLYGVILLPFLPMLVRDSMVTTKVIRPLDTIVTSSTSQGDQVLILGTASTSSYPMLLNLNRKPGSRFAWSFALDMATYARLNSKSNNWALEQSKIIEALVEDIRRRHPKLIAIETTPPTSSCLNGSLYQRLADHPVFTRALAHYRPAGICNGYAVWLPRSKRISPHVPTSHLPGVPPIQ